MSFAHPEHPAGFEARAGTFVLQCCYLLAVPRQNAQSRALEGSWSSGNAALPQTAPKKPRPAPAPGAVLQSSPRLTETVELWKDNVSSGVWSSHSTNGTSTMAFLTGISPFPSHLLAQRRILQIPWGSSPIFVAPSPARPSRIFGLSQGIEGHRRALVTLCVPPQGLEEHQWGQDTPETPARNQKCPGSAPLSCSFEPAQTSATIKGSSQSWKRVMIQLILIFFHHFPHMVVDLAVLD